MLNAMKHLFNTCKIVQPLWNTLRYKICDFIPWGKQILRFTQNDREVHQTPHYVSEWQLL